MERDLVLKRTAVFLFFGLIIIVLFNFFGILDLGGITGFAVFEGSGEGQTTLMFQEPDTENLGDAYVKGDAANKNFGLSDELHVKWGTPKRNAYLKFNISLIPENQIIDNASLCLYLYADQGNPITYVYHVYSDWDEGSLDGNPCGEACLVTENITWNNQPCGDDFLNSENCNLTAESNIITDGDQDGTWQCWSIVNMVNKDYSDGSSSISIALHTDEGGYADKFYSKEYTDETSLRPYLNITYHSANLAPLITLTEPQAQLYTSSESLALNFSVSDSDGNLDSCWYALDGGENISLADCVNTTFDVSGEGTYTLTIFANDSYGLEDSDSVSFTVDPAGISVLISQPKGAKSLRTGIPIEFTAIGASLTCWYNVKTSIGGGVIENTTLENCSNSDFDVSLDGDYVLNLYANNTYGSSDSDFSEFSVDTSAPPSGGGSSSGGGGGGSSIPLGGNVEITPIKVIVYPGEEKSLQASVKNKGIKTLNKCKLVGGGWIESDEIKNIGGGEIIEFKFILKVPGDAKGQPSVSLECMDYSTKVPLEVILIIPSLNIEFSKIDLVSKKEISVIYFVESDTNMDTEIVFRVSDSEGVVSEKTVQVEVSQSEELEAEVLLDISGAKTGELKISVTVAGEEKPMIEDSILYDSKLRTGFAVRDILTDSRTYVWLIVLVFFVVAFFIMRRILRFKKKRK